jgi:hypothetical protein
MSINTASVNGVLIRLTDERWAHIIFRHAELREAQSEVLSVVAQPELVVLGDTGEYSALREIAKGKWLVVVYREQDEEGFIITAFTTRRAGYYLDRKQIWP